jgi:DNA-binding transcriptional ArsR family regulator
MAKPRLTTMPRDIDATAAAALLRAVSNPARLRIAFCLLKGERSVTELENELGLRQPNLSQHLAELRNSGLVVGRREVKSVFYSLAGDESRQFVSGLLQSFGGAPAPAVTKVPSLAKRSEQAAVFAKVNGR